MTYAPRDMLDESCIFNDICRDQQGIEPFTLAWLSQFGAKLRKGCRKDVSLLADGRARLMVDYQSMPDLLAVLDEIDAIMAMTQEGGVQAASAKAGPWVPRRPAGRP